MTEGSIDKAPSVEAYSDSPRFSVILPAYNGGPYLRASVKSVLAQTYPHFDLLVLDDASTDGSVDWLSNLGDPRVRVYPAPCHLGIEANWSRTLDLPRQEYMTLLGQDDLLDAAYLAAMAALIKAHPEAGLYHAHFRLIDERGTVVRTCEPLPERESVGEWLSTFLEHRRFVHATGYVMRSEDYDAVGGIPLHPSLLWADCALWFHLAARGYKAASLEECFACRVHSASVSGSATVPVQMQALNAFISHLRQLSVDHPEVAAVVERQGAEFCLQQARSAYRATLKAANRRGDRIDPEVLATVTETLSRVAPELAPQVRDDRDIRRRERINRNPVHRSLHGLHARLLGHRKRKGAVRG